MSKQAFDTQELTPHGKLLVPPLGRAARERWAAAGLEVPCKAVAAFADDSWRDVQTARLFLKGFGCEGQRVYVGNASDAPDMAPTLSDFFVQPGCPEVTEAQARGRFGGDVDALTDAHAGDIVAVERALGLPADARACDSLPPDAKCSLLSFPYVYTGVPWQGLFAGPLYYVSFAARSFFLGFGGAAAAPSPRRRRRPPVAAAPSSRRRRRRGGAVFRQSQRRRGHRPIM